MGVLCLALLGADSCLDGLTFVITGVLESLEREEAADIIKSYGGRVTGNVSGKTNYLVIGDDAGESKKAKVREGVEWMWPEVSLKDDKMHESFWRLAAQNSIGQVNCLESE